MFDYNTRYPGNYDATRFFTFSQSKVTSMAPTGYAYIPKNCDTGRCPVHIALHGCEQSEEFIGTRFVQYTGYNPVAEANDVIILYPQTIKSEKNP